MKTVTITLAGKEYTVEELQTKKNSLWRAKLETELKPVSDILEGGRLIVEKEMNAQNLGVVSGLANQLMGIAIKSMDTIIELVFSYSPALAADRERIEDGAYDSEFLDALMAILEFAYPFGSALKAIGNLSNGLSQDQTLQS